MQVFRKTWIKLLFSFLAYVAFTGSLQAAPPLPPDETMPVKEGLELWLDVSRLGSNNNIPISGQIVELKDLSGHDRNLRQEQFGKQPVLLRRAGTGVLRFDGVDDHYRFVSSEADKQKTSLKAVSVIMVVVPLNNYG